MEIITVRLPENKKTHSFEWVGSIWIWFSAQANATLLGAKAPKAVAKPVGVSSEHRGQYNVP
jgi:hypothetical protein